MFVSCPSDFQRFRSRRENLSSETAWWIRCSLRLGNLDLRPLDRRLNSFGLGVAMYAHGCDRSLLQFRLLTSSPYTVFPCELSTGTDAPSVKLFSPSDSASTLQEVEYFISVSTQNSTIRSWESSNLSTTFLVQG